MLMTYSIVRSQEGSITLPLSPNDSPTSPGPTTTFTATASSLASHYFDFKFLGRPEQCGNQASCDAFAAEFEWSEWMSVEEQNQYKYVIDVDGNGWSGRFHR